MTNEVCKLGLVHYWVGGTTDSSAAVCARLSEKANDVCLLVSANAELDNPHEYQPSTSSDDHVYRFEIDDLEPDTEYHYGIKLGSQTSNRTGTFRTHSPLGEPADFTIASSSCAGLRPEHPGNDDAVVPERVSNHPVFDTIRARQPLMFIHTGDLHYYDIGDGDEVPDHDVATFRRAYDDVFAQSKQQALYRDIATAYVWDDHDFGPDNSDSTSKGRENACQVYRERVPHYGLHDDYGIWQSWQIGRVLFVLLDVRAYRSPNDDDSKDKTMLGTAQKKWLRELLESSKAAFLVLVTGSRWFDNTTDDSWDSFADERKQLIDLFTETKWIKRMCVLSGDMHAIAIDTGKNAPGGIPTFQFAPLDSDPQDPALEDHYDLGPTLPGTGQYGILAVKDDGKRLSVTGTGYRNDEKLLSHTVTIEARYDAGDASSGDAGNAGFLGRIKAALAGLFDR